MFETKHTLTISCPELAAAITSLAAIFKNAGKGSTSEPPTNAAPPAPAPAPAPAAPVYTAPISPTQPAPIPTIPTAAVPGYTLEQISRAGGDLVSADPSKREALVTLLGQFGVQAISQLKPEHYGTFATALRGLGAKI